MNNKTIKVLFKKQLCYLSQALPIEDYREDNYREDNYREGN